MSKKEFFSHDFHARDHLRDVRKDFGLEGLGFYWCFVEILHENNGQVKKKDIENIAFDLRVDINIANAIVFNYNMFKFKNGVIYSERVIENLQKREEISEKRRIAAEQRWGENEQPKNAVIDEEDTVPPEDTKKAKEFYIKSIKQAFDKWCDNAQMDELLSHSIYDYRELFKAIIEQVRTEEFVVINNKKIPTYRYLQVLMKNVNNGALAILDRTMEEVETKCALGKVKNKTNYLISSLYNNAITLI